MGAWVRGENHGLATVATPRKQRPVIVTAVKKQILFVDDEPKVLQGLRRMLHGMRHDWNMEFVESGTEALDHLATSPADVVVSDMRMPGMDGSELLRAIADRHPSTVRMILSGQCDRNAVLKCVGPTHQFLTKPCDPELLKSTVARACRLRDHLPDERIKRAASSVQSLPSWPMNYSALTEELRSPTPSIQRIGEIVARDPAVAAKIMQLVSSGFFGSPQRVGSLERAVSLLGLDTLVALAQRPRVFFPFDREESRAPFLEALSTHCVVTAEAAGAVAESETEDCVLIGDAYASGLLHDIGILPFFADSPIHYLETTPRQAEQTTFDTTHDDVGAYLMGLWGLPDPIVRAIAYHRSPRHAPEQTCFGALTAVHVAHAVIEQDSTETPGTPPSIDMQYLEQIGCADRLDAWRQICRAPKPEGVT